MDILGLIAPYVSNPATVYGVCGALLVWAFASASLLFTKTSKLTKALNKTRLLFDEAADPAAFLSRYESVNNALLRHSVFASRWMAFSGTLVLPSRTGQPVRATVSPTTRFDADMLRDRTIGLDPRYHAALPNLLVGAGLLFTFLGLAVALSSASGVVSGSSGARNTALRTLLDTASFKFITSLVGMFLSIAYALFRKWRLHGVEVALDQFNMSIEKVIPTVTPVSLQQEQIALMERQASTLETFSNDLAVSLGQSIDQTFNERLAEHIGPLTEAIDRLSVSMTSRSEDAMETMLDGFLSKLDGGASGHMKDVTDSLSGLGERLSGLQDGLSDAAVRMAQSADAMAARMGEGAEQALARMTDQMSSLADTLRGMVDDTRSAGSEAGGAMAAQIGAAAAGFENASERIAQTLETAAANMDRRMSTQADESSTRLASQLEIMVGELRAVAEASRAAGTEAFNSLAQRVSGAATTFETTAAQVAAVLERAANDSSGTFGKGAEEAVNRIAAATEGMRLEMGTLLGEMRSSIAQAGGELRAGTEQSAAAMRTTIESAAASLSQSLDETARRLSTAGTTAASALEQGAERGGARISAAGEVLGGRADGLANEITRLTNAATVLAQRAVEFERVAGTAAAPLANATADLKLAGEAARSAVEPLALSTQGIARAIEQMNGIAARLEGTFSSTQRLISSLDDSAKRFSGVDQDLAKTLNALQAGLTSFSKQINTFVVETNNDLAKAATALNASIKGLEDVLEDYAPSQTQKRR